MLSVMETPLALTVLNPKGGDSLRILKNSKVFQPTKALIKSDLPVEEVWSRIKQFANNPLTSLRYWFARFGVNFSDKIPEEMAKECLAEFNKPTDFMLVDGYVLPKAAWMPYFERIRETGGNPKVATLFLDKLVANENDVFKRRFFREVRFSHPIHAGQSAYGTQNLGLLYILALPEEARPGDIVTCSSRGNVLHMVSFTEVSGRDIMSALVKGSTLDCKGVVLYPILGAMRRLEIDLMNQPMLLGFNRTYQCEEGSSNGWLVTESTDSLMEAKKIVEEVRASGSEARIVNRLTGDVID